VPTKAKRKETKFLSIVEERKEDMMWLYFPVLGRDRRIAAYAKEY